MLNPSFIKQSVPDYLLVTLNQLFQIEQKVSKINEQNSIKRNIERIKEEFKLIGLTMHNPDGEVYSETRTDCEASIAGNSTENLFISEVIKPIIRFSKENTSVIIQRGVVVVESRTSQA